jgi:hypothetical protein
MGLAFNVVRRFGPLLVSFFLPNISHALDLSSVPPTLLQHAKSSGLIVEGPPVVAFTWSLDVKKPMRSARRQIETFAGSASSQQPGLSTVKRARHQGPNESAPAVIQEYFSARGMMNLRPDDEETEMHLAGLVWPLKAQDVFKFSLKDENGSLKQDCTIAPVVEASQLHSKLKGNVFPIQCVGDGKYKGVSVRIYSSLWFIEQLGVFFNSDDAIKSPLGTFNATVKIIDVKFH